MQELKKGIFLFLAKYKNTQNPMPNIIMICPKNAAK